jgi:hypothetical protein
MPLPHLNYITASFHDDGQSSIKINWHSTASPARGIQCYCQPCHNHRNWRHCLTKSADELSTAVPLLDEDPVREPTSRLEYQMNTLPNRQYIQPVDSPDSVQRRNKKQRLVLTRMTFANVWSLFVMPSYWCSHWRNDESIDGTSAAGSSSRTKPMVSVYDLNSIMSSKAIFMSSQNPRPLKVNR